MKEPKKQSLELQEAGSTNFTEEFSDHASLNSHWANLSGRKSVPPYLYDSGEA